jgi:hypothetical protein
MAVDLPKTAFDKVNPIVNMAAERGPVIIVAWSEG